MTRIVGALAAVFLVTLAVTAQSRNGRDIFRFDTFGDEQLWTTTLQMHTVIPKLTPRAALGLGLKVDVEALPLSVITALKADPEVTARLTEGQLEELFDLGYHLKRVDTIFERVFG